MSITVKHAITDLDVHPALSSRRSSARDLLVGIETAQDTCYLLAKHAGWHDNIDYSDVREVATKLALIHSEVSEALEGARKDTMDSHLTDRPTIEVELADVLIRVFDLAGALGLDLGQAVVRKLAYNTTRKDHTREARAAAGGKKV